MLVFVLLVLILIELDHTDLARLSLTSSFGPRDHLVKLIIVIVVVIVVIEVVGDDITSGSSAC